MPDDETPKISPRTSLSLLSQSSPASSTSSLAGMKRASEPESPAVRHSRPREMHIGGSIGESEWHRCCPLTPPYPIALVGRVPTMGDRFVKYLRENFVQRLRPANGEGPEAAAEKKCRFRRKNIPVITLREYMARVCNYVVALEPVMLLAVLAYAHILDPPEGSGHDHGHGREGVLAVSDARADAPRLAIDLYAVHRFLITGICVASKALGDHYYSNAFYAKVGGISTAELNSLELELAMLLNWRLQLSQDEQSRYWKLLEGMDSD